MNLSDLKELVDWHYNKQLENLYPHPADIEVGVVVETIGQIGGTPIVAVHKGFDWDNGKLLIYPQKKLRTIEADELLALRKANEKQGWAEYENKGLKAEVKKLNTIINKLKEN
jgi:hypothetical protein